MTARSSSVSLPHFSLTLPPNWTGSFTEPIDFIAFNERAAPAIQAGTYVKSGFTQYEDVYKDLDESTVTVLVTETGCSSAIIALNAWRSTFRG